MKTGEMGRKKISGDTLNRYILIILLVAEIAIFSFVSPYFLTIKNIFSILLNISVLGIVSIGQTLCILTSDFDLSVGGAACFTGVMMGFFFAKVGLPYGVAFILALVVAALIGLVNGVLITKLKINAFITTMATNFMLGGMVLLVSGGQAILVSDKIFGLIGKTTFTSIKIPLPMIILLILFLVFAWILKNTVFGRHVYCIGGNAESAKIAGINIDKVKIIVYMLSSTLAGFAGIVLASRMAAAQISVGTTYGMESIAGTVLGGTILAGGKGNMMTTLVGVLITGILSNGLTMIGASQAWRDIATGLLLIFAIIMQNTTSKIRK
ncbi:MAG: ABC transporter permease [Muricoprocola sp.]